MKLSGGATAKRRELADAKPGRGGKRCQGARAQRGDGAERASPRACRGKEGAWRSGSPRTRRSLAPPKRARACGAASFLRARPALLLQQAEARSESREVWGEVGGASHASAASQRREGEGEILDNVTPSTTNQEPA